MRRAARKGWCEAPSVAEPEARRRLAVPDLSGLQTAGTP